MNNSLKVYIELLKYDRSLKKDGTSLQEQDRDKYLEMLNYSVKLSDHVHWQQKSHYLNLMKNFVDLKINGKQFVGRFNKLHQSTEKAAKTLIRDLEQLNTFEINPKSFGFTVWTSEMDLGCDEFCPDFLEQYQVENTFSRDEENLRAFVADIIPEIEKY